MAKVTNHSQVTLSLPTGTKENPENDDIYAGETKDMNLDLESPFIKAYLNTGAIAVEGHKSEPAVPKRR